MVADRVCGGGGLAGAHAGRALGLGSLGGNLGGREARRQRVGRQNREDLGRGDGDGGERVIWWGEAVRLGGGG